METAGNSNPQNQHDSTHNPPEPAAPLVTGNLWQAVWSMSWPLMITTVATAISNLADVHVAGYLGSHAQAAVGVAEQVLFIFELFLISFGIGTTAMISRAYGAGNYKEVSRLMAQSMSLAIMTGIIMALAALLVARNVLPMLTGAPDVLEQGKLYLSIYGIYLLPFGLVCMSSAAFRGIGDTRTPLYVSGTEAIIAIAGDYLTVRYNWPVPGLGIKGIAVSELVGSLVAICLVVYRIRRSVLRDSLSQLLPLSWGTIARIAAIGFPAALHKLSWGASVLVLLRIFSMLHEPKAALAAWTIGMRVESVLFMPVVALSLAVSAIVGQNLGASQARRAYRSGLQASCIGVGIMTAIGAIVFLNAEQVAVFLSRAGPAVAYTAVYLRINAFTAAVEAVNMILSGALHGSGDTRTPMWISMATAWLVRLPLAWLLAIGFNWGPNGAWYAMLISMVLSACLTAMCFVGKGWSKASA